MTSPANIHSLTVATFDSPGSSIFDLPTKPEAVTTTRSQTLPPSNTLPVASRTDVVGQGEPSFIVVSGGTGGNAICSAFNKACFVLPVSDDGGSSSEIIRVLGGPSIGDIRSRLVRLIPAAPPGSPLEAIRGILAYRLPSHVSEQEARAEWREIVEGRSILWSGVPADRKETIRGFLVYFESEALKRAHKNFSFRNGSIGNYFLAAAQNFFRSLPSAIFLFSSITNSQAHILPVIITNHTVTIAAELENGQRLVGQCEISHPVVRSEYGFTSELFASDDSEEGPSIEGLAEWISPKPNNLFEAQNKQMYEPLPARITRVYYINGYGMEIDPSPNPDFITNLATKDMFIYSCGSLWTSIIPCLALKGVAKAIASSSSLKAKLFLLNFENDRETEGYTATDYITAVTRTLNTNHQRQPYGLGSANTIYPVSAFVTDIVYLKGSRVPINVEQITKLGVRCREVDGGGRFDADVVRRITSDIWAEVNALD